MLTVEQLYEIMTHKNDTVGPDGDPRNRAASALYSLWEEYRKKNAAEEIGFSDALSTMMAKAERVIQEGADQETFAKELRSEVAGFRSAYDKLPDQVRDQGTLKAAFDAVSAMNPDELAYEREMAKRMEDLVMGNDTVMKFRADTHPAQAKLHEMVEDWSIAPNAYEKAAENVKEMRKASENDLRNTLAVMMAMDSLRRNEDLKAAVDPQKVDAEAKKLMNDSLQFKMAWNVIGMMEYKDGQTEPMAYNAEGLKRAFRLLSLPDLAKRIDPAADIVTARLKAEAENLAKETQKSKAAKTDAKKKKAVIEDNQPVIAAEQPVAAEDQPVIAEDQPVTEDRQLDNEKELVMEEKETDKVVSSKDLDELAYEKEMAALMESLVMTNDSVLKFQAGTHPAYDKPNQILHDKTKDATDYADALEDVKEMQKANEEFLMSHLATIMAMDSLHRSKGPKAATDPQQVDELAEQLMEKSSQYQIVWNLIHSMAYQKGQTDPMAYNAAGLKEAFSKMALTDLANRVDPAARAGTDLRKEEAETMAKEAEDQKKAQPTDELEKKEAAYRDGFRNLALQVIRIKDHVDQVRRGVYKGPPVEGCSIEDYKVNLSALIAMHDTRKNMGIDAALNQDTLKSETSRVMQSQGMKLIMDSLKVQAGADMSLETMFRGLRRPDLGDAIAVARIAYDEPQKEGPGKTGPEDGKIPSDPTEISRESPVQRFKSKLEEMKKAVQQARGELKADANSPSAAPGSRKYAETLKNDLRELFALRELGKNDPTSPVTSQQVWEQQWRITNQKGGDLSLYRGVLRIKDVRRIENVVEALQGDENPQEFAQKVTTAAKIRFQSQEEREEKRQQAAALKQ